MEEDTGGKMAIQDVQNLLRDVFEMSHYEIYDHKDDKDHFFKKINSYVKFFKVIKRYFDEKEDTRKVKQPVTDRYIYS